MEAKSQAWKKLFTKHASLLTHKAEELVSVPNTPLATVINKLMTFVAYSREAGRHSSLFPSLELLECISTQPGAVHFLHIHSDPMKHKRIEGTEFTEGKKCQWNHLN